MPQFMNCAACQARLRIPDGVTERWLTCPRCLASVVNPAWEVAAAATGITTSAGGGTPLAPSPVPLEEQIALFRAADADVQRDSRGMHGCMIALAVLGVIQIWLILLGIAVTGEAGAVGAGIGFLVLIGVAVLLVRARENPTARGVARVAVGLLAVIGALVLAAVALGFLFFLVCTAMLVSGAIR
jgi:hypothetical protein